jgi:hypothetical protein
MIWIGIAWLGCAAIFVECVVRAPLLEEQSD